MKKIFILLIVISIMIISVSAIDTQGQYKQYIMLSCNAFNIDAASSAATNIYTDFLPNTRSLASGSNCYYVIGKFCDIVKPGIYNIQLVFTADNGVPDAFHDGLVNGYNTTLKLFTLPAITFSNKDSIYTARPAIDYVSTSEYAKNLFSENQSLNTDDEFFSGYITRLNSQSWQFDAVIKIDDSIYTKSTIDQYICIAFYNPVAQNMQIKLQLFDFYNVESFDLDKKFDAVIDALDNISQSTGLDERAVHDAVLTALNDFDDQERSAGNAAVDDVQEFMGGHTQQYTDSLNVLMASMDAADDIFTSNSKTMQLTFPAAQLPQLSGVASGGTMWASQTIDFSDAIDAIPDQLMQVVRLILDVGVYFAILRTIIKLIQWILDVNNPDLDIGWWEIL